MPVKDPFSYSSRWDSVGLDCSDCINFCGPSKWPDKERISYCKLHKRSLEIELGENGYKEGEWFCKHFTPDRTASRWTALGELDRIRHELDSGKLYGAYGEQGYLQEYDFTELKPTE